MIWPSARRAGIICVAPPQIGDEVPWYGTGCAPSDVTDHGNRSAALRGSESQSARRAGIPVPKCTPIWKSALGSDFGRHWVPEKMAGTILFHAANCHSEIASIRREIR